MNRVILWSIRLVLVLACGRPAVAELVAYYSFERPFEASGPDTLVHNDAATDPNNQYAALVHGAARIREPDDENNFEGKPGVRGSYLSLNGPGDGTPASGYLDLPIAEPMATQGNTDGWSFAAWVRRSESPDNQQAIFAVNPAGNNPDENRYQLYINDTRGGIKVGGVWSAITTRPNHLTGWMLPGSPPGNWITQYRPNASASGSSTTQVAEGTGPGTVWHHVAVVVRTIGGTPRVHYYIDGVEAQEGGALPHDALFGDLAMDDRWSVGQDWDLIQNVAATTDFLKGDLDEVRLYNHALSEAELLELVRAGYELHFDNPPRWAVYTLDQASALVARLRAENSNSDTETIAYNTIEPGDIRVHISPYRTATGSFGAEEDFNAVVPAGADYLEADLSTYFAGKDYPVGNYRLRVTAPFPRENAVDVVLDAETYFTVVDPAATSSPVDRDNDGVNDALELMYFGNTFEHSALPTLGGGVPHITDASYMVGGTLAGADAVMAGSNPNPVIFTFLTANVTSASQVSIRNALVDQAVSPDNITFTSTSNGGEIQVLVAEGEVDPTKHLTQRYVVTLDNQSGDPQVFDLFFQIDPIPPAVQADPPGGRFSGPSLGVRFTPSEPLSAFAYRVNGGTYANVPVESLPTFTTNLTSSALVEVTATDLAGNVGESRFLFVNDTATPVPGGVSVSNESGGAVTVGWNASTETAAPGGGFLVYRTLTLPGVELNDTSLPEDLRRLKLSATGEDNANNPYPAPGDLLVRDTLVPAGNNSWIDDEMTEIARAGMKAWYAVAYQTPDGRVGPPSSPVPILGPDVSAPNPADIDEVVRAVTLYLVSIRNNDGSWGEGGQLQRIRATSEVLNAFAALPPAAVERSVIERGLEYLQGTFLDHHEAIARQIDTLQRFGIEPYDLHVRLAYRAAVLDEGTSTPRVGWGAHRAYLPDPWHTALAESARRGARQPVPDIPDANPDSVADLLAQPWMLALVDASSDSAVVSAQKRYGWVPNNRDSIAVSAEVFRALGQNRFMGVGFFGTSPTPGVSGWIINVGNLDAQSRLDFRGNLFDTATTLLHLRLDTSHAKTKFVRAQARAYLVHNRDPAGHSWGDSDPFLTARCLRALISPRAFLVTVSTTTSNEENGYKDLKRAVESRGFAVTKIKAADLGNDAALRGRVATQGALVGVVSAGATPADEAGLAFLRDLPLPVINMNATLADELGFAASDGDSTVSESAVSVDADHPVLRDVSGAVNGGTLTILIPNPPRFNAVKLPPDTPGVLARRATPAPDGDWWAVLLARDAGTPLPGGRTAPGARLLLPFAIDGGSQHGNGMDLLDAAVEWATSRRIDPR